MVDERSSDRKFRSNLRKACEIAQPGDLIDLLFSVPQKTEMLEEVLDKKRFRLLGSSREANGVFSYTFERK